MNNRNNLLVIIPTRNRSELAINAINSVFTQLDGANINVLVSDNSTKTIESEKLTDFFRKVNDSRICYIKPPESMAMARHWEWVMNEALHLYNFTHCLFLTDRMVFKKGYVKTINNITKEYPDKIVSYNIDRIDDSVEPIALEQLGWTGKLLEINSSHLLKLSSQSIFHHSLPRMLNCVVPRCVFVEIKHRFGNVFISTSPDFCFCYRSLDITNSIYYYDKSVLIQYAITKSNGANHAKGTTSEDSVDFISNITTKELSFLSPIPEIITVGNAIIHEYCLAKSNSKNGNFPEVDYTKYLDGLGFEANKILNEERRKEMTRILIYNGWKKNKFYYFRIFKKTLGLFLNSSYQKVESVEDAIDYINTHPLRKRNGNLYLKLLLRYTVLVQSTR